MCRSVWPCSALICIFTPIHRSDIVHECVRYQRALFRQPYKTKRSFEISGSTKKPHPQKGGGKAQAGNKRASHWRGGQKAHGPHLRSFAFDMNKKSRAMALMITLAAKHREGNLMIFDEFDVQTHRTKDFFELMKKHGLHDKKLILIDEIITENLLAASGNVPTVTSMIQAKTNVYDILKREKLLMSRDAFQRLQGRLVAQYTHVGGMKSRLDGLESMKTHPGFAMLDSDSTA
jgi:large subunit ribosomal protein L4